MRGTVRAIHGAFGATATEAADGRVLVLTARGWPPVWEEW